MRAWARSDVGATRNEVVPARIEIGFGQRSLPCGCAGGRQFPTAVDKPGEKLWRICIFRIRQCKNTGIRPLSGEILPLFGEDRGCSVPGKQPRSDLFSCRGIRLLPLPSLFLLPLSLPSFSAPAFSSPVAWQRGPFRFSRDTRSLSRRCPRTSARPGRY